jgi:hypothetical protein
MSVTIEKMILRPPWIGLLLIAATASALFGSPVSHPFVTGAGREASFRTFEDDAGGFYLVWADARPDSSIFLRAQHLDAQGRSGWDQAGLVISPRLASDKDWNGLADGQGGLTLFWDESDGVHTQRFLPDGTRRRSGESVHMSSSTAIQPDAVPDAEGGTLIVWRETLSIGRSVLMAQRLDTEGKPVWPAGGIRVSLRASNQTNPRAIDDNMSGMIVAWRDEANSASELRVQRLDFQGNRLWSLEGLKITAPVGVSDFPILAPLGSGEAVLAWNGASSQTNQIFLQKVGPEPALKWGNKTLSSNIPTAYNRWNPVLLGGETGGTWIAWEDFRNQMNYQIQLNHLDRSGKSDWLKGEIAVAPAAGEQGKTAMTGDGKEGVWLAWIDNRLSTVGLYVQEIAADGSRLQGSKGRLIADDLTKPMEPRLVAVAAGKAVVAWVNRPKKDQWMLSWDIIETP